MNTIGIALLGVFAFIASCMSAIVTTAVRLLCFTEKTLSGFDIKLLTTVFAVMTVVCFVAVTPVRLDGTRKDAE